MKQLTYTLLTVLLALSVGTAKAQYRILHEADTIIKAQFDGSFSFGSREVKFIAYDYPSTDVDGKTVNVSGAIVIPSDIMDGSMPCDGVIMYNHYTVGSPDEVPSQGKEGLDAIGGMLANPLKPNFIFVACDYIGYGSSIDSDVCYISGDTNSRNALDGLLAARQLFEDRNIPQGKFLFNIGFSQGGTVSMFAGKLTDTDEKYRGIRFDKTYSGGGPLDFEKMIPAYITRDACENVADVMLMLISANENYHLGIDYKDMFQEPMASKALEFFKSKKKSSVSAVGVTAMDSIHQLLTPTFMDIESEPVKKVLTKMKEINLTSGWEPDTTKNYYIEHSRHDNYVPIQSVRSVIPWMREKGFRPSIVPGKSSLQTATIVFKLKHQQSGIVWAIQTMAAIQFWPVLYYEGEQNRYFHDVVGDLNVMKVIKTLESWGIDLGKIIQNKGLSRRELPERYTYLDMISGVGDFLAKVGLTTDDLEEMIADAGITLEDLLRAYAYLSQPKEDATRQSFEERVEAPLYLLRSYEQTLANWFQLAGYDVDYDLWGM
jgi:hypothetical protein